MKQLRDAIIRRRPRAPEKEEAPAKPIAPIHAMGETYRPRDTMKSLSERLKTPTMEQSPKPLPPTTGDGQSPLPPRQIWDLDAEADEVASDTSVEPSPLPEPTTLRARPLPDRPDVVPATPAPAPVSEGPPAARPLTELRGIPAPQALPVALDTSIPKAASGGRAKTRILGFHAAEIEADVFSGPAQPRTEADKFPCGWVVVVDGPGRGASFSIRSGMSTIGRSDDHAISLDFGDMSISRSNHAMVAYDEEQSKFFIGHGGKSNVVRRNGNPILTTEELQDGDLIRIGKTTLRFVALCGADFTWAEGEDNAEPVDTVV